MFCIVTIILTVETLKKATDFASKFMIYIHIKFKMPVCTGSFVIIITKKLKNKQTHTYTKGLNRRCMSFRDYRHP